MRGVARKGHPYRDRRGRLWGGAGAWVVHRHALHRASSEGAAGREKCESRTDDLRINDSLYKGGNGTIHSALFGIRGSGGSGAFVGAGRRSLALSERSELASDGREQRRHPRCLCWRVSERAIRHASANRIPRLSCSGTPRLSCSHSLGKGEQQEIVVKLATGRAH